MSNAKNKITKRQVKIMRAIDDRRQKRKLGEIRDGILVTDDMLDDLSKKSLLDKIHDMLPRQNKFQLLESHTSDRNNFVRRNCSNMPHRPLKKHTVWIKDIPPNDLSLSTELMHFMEYASVLLDES